MDSVVQAAIVYLLLWIVIRLTGRRALGQLSTFEFVLFLIIGGTVQRALLGQDYSLTNAIIVIATLVGLDVAVSLVEQRSALFSKIVRGVPTILVENGRPLESRLMRARLGEADVMSAARLRHGIDRIEDIKFAILEANGHISIIPRERPHTPARTARPARSH
jgi:uncharacterized membrane protein YcaP (DUF421 family)